MSRSSISRALIFFILALPLLTGIDAISEAIWLQRRLTLDILNFLNATAWILLSFPLLSIFLANRFRLIYRSGIFVLTISLIALAMKLGSNWSLSVTERNFGTMLSVNGSTTWWGAFSYLTVYLLFSSAVLICLLASV